MTILDEDGFAIQEYQGKQVRSNFWNQISPRVQDQLEKVNGFNTSIGEWYYYVKEIKKSDDTSYFVIFKNPNYKKLLEPSVREDPEIPEATHPTNQQQQQQEKEKKEVDEYFKKQKERTTPAEIDPHILYNLKEREKMIGRAELPTDNPELLYLSGDSINLPRSLLDKYVSIIVIKKNVNIQIPEMYELIKNFKDVSVLGISRTRYASVTVRDVFGTQ